MYLKCQVAIDIALPQPLIGKVYTFGINEFKTLGFENKIEDGGIHETWTATLKPDISNVERVSSGYRHVAVYKEDGNIFTWGQGENR